MAKVLSFPRQRGRVVQRITINSVDVEKRTVECRLEGESFIVRQIRKGRGWRKVFIVVSLPRNRILKRLETQALYKATYNVIQRALRANAADHRFPPQLSLFSA